MYLNIRGSIYDTAATNIRLSVRDWYIRMYKRRARLHWLRSIQSETNEISTLNVTLAYKKKNVKTYILLITFFIILSFN